MQEEKDILELIANYPQEFEDLDPSLLDDAKRLAERKYGNKGKRKNKIFWSTMIASISLCMIFLAVFLPVYFLKNTDKPNETRYFSTEKIYTEDIMDIDKFVSKNSLKLKIFQLENSMSTYKANYIQATGEFVFLSQETLVIAASSFDKVNIGIVVTADEFAEFDEYINLNLIENISNLTVNYKITVIEDLHNGKESTIMAKFRFNTDTYFMTINTGDSVGKLSSYVKAITG